MELKKFSGKQVFSFLSMHGGMPVQATPVKIYAANQGFDYDSFRFACDDYMRGVWITSSYRKPGCRDKPKQGRFGHVYVNMSGMKLPPKNLGASGRVSVGTVVNAQNIIDFLAMQDGRCPCCEAILERSGYHIDHIKPLKLGGANHLWNLQLLCPGCNLRKSATDPVVWADQYGIPLPQYYLNQSNPFE